MIQEFVTRFDAARDKLLAGFTANHPGSYTDIVKAVVEVLNVGDHASDSPDPERITVIDHGEYQGTQLFVIGDSGYHPSKYWAVAVGYGSCSGCDTLEGIRDYSGEPPTEEQAKEYMTLALHVLQGLKQI